MQIQSRAEMLDVQNSQIDGRVGNDTKLLLKHRCCVIGVSGTPAKVSADVLLSIGPTGTNFSEI